MTLALGLALTLTALGPRDGWADVEKAARVAESAPATPALDRVRAQRRGLEGLFDAELAESIAAVRHVEPALAALDAAAVAPLCKSRHPLDARGAQSVLALAEHALAAALLDAHLDARDRRPASRAAASLGRALSLAFVVERCAAPPLDALATSLDIHARARFVAWHLAEQRLVSPQDLAAIAEQMGASANGASMERALEAHRANVKRAPSLDEQQRIEALGKRIDDATRERALLTNAAGAFDAIERPQAFDPMRVELVCARAPAEGGAATWVVSRAVVRALELRGMERLGADTQVTPTFDGRGVLISSAGPFARSCGFQDGDMLVDVNGVSTARGDAMVQAPAAVARDGEARFRVVRDGAALEWFVRVDGRR